MRDGRTSQREAARCRVILLAHQGESNVSIAERVDLSRPTVLSMRAAFTRGGVSAITGITKRKRQGKVLTVALEQKILDTTLKTRPGDGSTHWSTRMLAPRGIRTIVHRVSRPTRVERSSLEGSSRNRCCPGHGARIGTQDRWPGFPGTAADPLRPAPGTTTHVGMDEHAVCRLPSIKVIATCKPIAAVIEPTGEGRPRHLNIIVDKAEPQKPGVRRWRKTRPATHPFPLHSHQQFLAQSRRAILCPDYPAHDPSRHLSYRPRTRTSHLPLASQLERRSRSLHLEGPR